MNPRYTERLFGFNYTSIIEFMKASEKAFAKADADDNGLSKKEFAAAGKKLP